MHHRLHSGCVSGLGMRTRREAEGILHSMGQEAVGVRDDRDDMVKRKELDDG